MTELDQADSAGRRGRENEADGPALVPGGELPRLSSRTLFRSAREIIIEHDGADYRLRLTTNGKLILTK